MVNAVTFIPNLAANWIARWPKPPIPIIAHSKPAFPYLFIGEKTVTPAHNKGAALTISSLGLIGNVQLWLIWIWVA